VYVAVCVLIPANSNGLLLATDVAARGLDIPGVQHVIHYQVPRTTEVCAHCLYLLICVHVRIRL